MSFVNAVNSLKPLNNSGDDLDQLFAEISSVFKTVETELPKPAVPAAGQFSQQEANAMCLQARKDVINQFRRAFMINCLPQDIRVKVMEKEPSSAYEVVVAAKKSQRSLVNEVKRPQQVQLATIHEEEDPDLAALKTWFKNTVINGNSRKEKTKQASGRTRSRLPLSSQDKQKPSQSGLVFSENQASGSL